VASGYCVKSTDSKCFIPSTYLYDYSSLNNLGKISFIPCIICVEGYIPDFSGKCKKMDNFYKFNGCLKYHYIDSQNGYGCAVCSVQYI